MAKTTVLLGSIDATKFTSWDEDIYIKGKAQPLTLPSGKKRFVHIHVKNGTISIYTLNRLQQFFRCLFYSYLTSKAYQKSLRDIGLLPLYPTLQNSELRKKTAGLWKRSLSSGFQDNLIHVSKWGTAEALRFYAKQGIPLNTIQDTATNGTLLHIAIKYGKLEVAKELIKQGLSTQTPNAQGNTPFQLACNRFDADKYLSLFATGARSHLSNKNLPTSDKVLAEAIKSHNIALVKTYLKKSSLRAKDYFFSLVEEGDPACKKCVEMVSLLANKTKSSDLNLKDCLTKRKTAFANAIVITLLRKKENFRFNFKNTLSVFQEYAQNCGKNDVETWKKLIAAAFDPKDSKSQKRYNRFFEKFFAYLTCYEKLDPSLNHFFNVLIDSRPHVRQPFQWKTGWRGTKFTSVHRNNESLSHISLIQIIIFRYSTHWGSGSVIQRNLIRQLFFHSIKNIRMNTAKECYFDLIEIKKSMLHLDSKDPQLFRDLREMLEKQFPEQATEWKKEADEKEKVKREKNSKWRHNFFSSHFNNFSSGNFGTQNRRFSSTRSTFSANKPQSASVLLSEREKIGGECQQFFQKFCEKQKSFSDFSMIQQQITQCKNSDSIYADVIYLFVQELAKNPQFVQSNKEEVKSFSKQLIDCPSKRLIRYSWTDDKAKIETQGQPYEKAMEKYDAFVLALRLVDKEQQKAAGGNEDLVEVLFAIATQYVHSLDKIEGSRNTDGGLIFLVNSIKKIGSLNKLPQQDPDATERTPSPYKEKMWEPLRTHLVTLHKNSGYH